MQMTVKHACDLINIDLKSYELSFAEAMSRPEIAEQIKKDEEFTRLIVEEKRSIVQSRDEMKAIVIEMRSLEGEVDKKLARLQVANQQ